MLHFGRRTTKRQIGGSAAGPLEGTGASAAGFAIFLAPRMRGTAIALVVAMTGIGATAARADVVQPYGTHDAGGFRNILPAGEAGTDNALQLGVFQGTGTRPAHWDDQLPLYANLLYASPHLKHSQIASFYKDATFGVIASDVESK